MGAIFDYLKLKLKEGSTWSGLAMVVGGLSFIPHAADVAALLPAVGTVVAGLLSIYFK